MVDVAVHSGSLVTDIAIVLAVAGIVAAIFRRLRQPAILGYLLVGLIVGPYIPTPVFADVERMHAVSELGVVLVMFAVGLEFSLHTMVQVLPNAGGIALVQIGLLGWCGYVLGQWLGLSQVAAVFLGSSIAISSTMVVAKVFEEAPPAAAVRRLVFGVLVLQDVVAIVLLAMLSGLAVGGEPSSATIATTVARLVLLLALMTAVGLVVVPPFIRRVDQLGSEETLLIAAIGTGFGTVWIADWLGYSHALGAFLGGMLVAESGLAKKVEHSIQPLRDVFAALFFVSIGMSVDPVVAASHLGTAVLVATIVIVAQFSSVTIAGLLSGAGLRSAVTAGLALGQIGEFGFIMTDLGQRAGLVPPKIYAAVVTAAVITAFTTPALLRRAPAVASWIDRRLPRRIGVLLGVYEAWLDQVRHAQIDDRRKRAIYRAIAAIAIDGLVVAVLVISISLTLAPATTWISGVLPISRMVAVVLMLGLTVLAVAPFVLGILRAARNLGLRFAEVIMPPVSSEKIDMRREGRRVVVVSIQLLALLAVSVPLVAIVQPFVPSPWGAIAVLLVVAPAGVYFWRRAETFHMHMRAGTEVVLAMLARKEDVTRDETVQDLLAGLGYAARLRVPAESPVIDRTLGELDIRVRTGATILAIARGEHGVFSPSGQDRIGAGDELAVAGSPEAVEQLRALLEQG